MKKYILALVTALFLLAPLPSEAALTANSAFVLIQKVPPGEYLPDAKAFLGAPSSERVVDMSLGIKIIRWGRQDDTWTLDVLHDEDTVRATKIIWRTKSRSEQQTIFSQITTAGKNFFGKPAAFNGMNEAEWSDFGGRWIVRATIEQDMTKGVILLSGIRDANMDSGKFGF